MFSVELLNQSSKKVVAYVIDVRQFDASNNQVGSPLVVGTDNVFTQIPSAGSLLVPNAKMIKQFGPLSSVTVSATATVVSVVYLDRTSEGDPKQTALLLKNRKLRGDHAESLAQLLATYPNSPDELKLRLSKIAVMSERVGDIEPLRHNGIPSKEQWEAAAAKQKAFADLLTSYAKAPE